MTVNRGPTERECWHAFFTRAAMIWIWLPRDIKELCIAEAALLDEEFREWPVSSADLNFPEA